ncbi:MAG: efflux RND transporter periplasmic adaptor subunit [Rhodospirillaceae bacterium]|nr:efflux RND transporter periplasmic adaptor subunit [Rhodospirillaceae bacterium]
MNKQIITSFGTVAVGLILAGLILQIDPSSHEHDHGEAVAAETEFERGPHNGRLLRDGAVAVEMTIFEDGVPPEYRIYAYTDSKPVDPKTVELSVELGRLGGIVDTITFKAENDYLRGQETVVEPHSFDVKVVARINNKSHSWTYPSYEGRVEISPEAAEAGGLKTEIAGPTKIREVAVVTGRIVSDPMRVARIKARFPGIVRELRKSVGDTVAKGEIVARVESNDSLQTYAVTSPIDGNVVMQNVNVGEAVDDMPLIEIADTRRVIAELLVFPGEVARLKVGQAARVRGIGGEVVAEGVLGSILPTTQAGSQAVPARVMLDNADLQWRPGMMVEADITTGERDAALAVRMSGLQKFRDFDVVFAKVSNTYEVRMLELGVDDGEWIEVLGGLAPGTTYVTENSFLIKADIEKSGASHDH